MIKNILLVGLGGSIGSVARYLCQKWISGVYPSAFPWGTFLVNITGCFLIGIFFAAIDKTATVSQDWRLFLMTGICGGFTTFSAFALENMNLMHSGNMTYAFIYTLASVVVGVCAVAGGIALIRIL